MTGGINWPLVEQATSIAPAFSREKPTFFINGMVKVPVVTTLAMEDPETRPVKPEEITAAFAGPPFRCPRAAKAVRIK